MAATTTSNVSFPHFSEPTNVTSTFDVDHQTGRWAYTNLDVRWIDASGRRKLKAITSISKKEAWNQARNFARKLTEQGLSPTISASPDRPLMMQLIDLVTGEITYNLRRYSVNEATEIMIRFRKNAKKLPLFVMTPSV